MNALRTLVNEYRTAFADEPKMRAYAVASFIDDLGVAVTAWAGTLMMTNLFTSQRERASLALPSLACFLLGTIVSGPLADWASRRSLLRLAHWRWRVVLWARLASAATLGILMLSLAQGAPTLARVLPFTMVFAFSKSAFRPTRTAFSVDLLRHETRQVDANGAPRTDERGQPLMLKTHLLAMTSLIETLSAAAVLFGLLLGGRILALAEGRYWQLFLIDAVMQLGFVALVFFGCNPARAARNVRLRELFGDAPEDRAAEPSGTADAGRERLSFFGGVAYFFRSIGGGVRFLAQKEQRPLLVLLAGAALVELVTESYDGKMIVKHVLHGSDEAVRHAEIVWSVVGLVVVAAVPALARMVGSIGRIFLVTMLLDGLAIVMAGRVCGAESPGAVLPFTAILAVDHSLTLASTSLTELAQNSASSAAMRGRIAGAYGFFVILGDMMTEGLATTVSEAIGIPAMLVRVGALQLVVVTALALWGGAGLFRFGVKDAPSAGLSSDARPARPARV
jgi:MFS family permease